MENQQLQNNHVINYQDILSEVKEKNEVFVQKHSKHIEKVISDHQMFVHMAYAKISFIAKILFDAKVITDYKEIEIIAEGTLFQRSVVLISKPGFSLIYLLNSGKDIYVYEGIAVEYPGNLSFLVWTRNEQTKKYSNIFDNDFDWKGFAIYITETVHKSLFKLKEMDNAFFQLLS